MTMTLFLVTICTLRKFVFCFGGLRPPLPTHQPRSHLKKKKKKKKIPVTFANAQSPTAICTAEEQNQSASDLQACAQAFSDCKVANGTACACAVTLTECTKKVKNCDTSTPAPTSVADARKSLAGCPMVTGCSIATCAMLFTPGVDQQTACKPFECGAPNNSSEFCKCAAIHVQCMTLDDGTRQPIAQCNPGGDYEANCSNDVCKMRTTKASSTTTTTTTTTTPTTTTITTTKSNASPNEKATTASSSAPASDGVAVVASTLPMSIALVSAITLM
jgi:hypothetical protein